MARRGKVKCECLRCSATCMVHKGQFDRAAGARCTQCGGPLDVVSKRGRETMLTGYTESRSRNR